MMRIAAVTPTSQDSVTTVPVNVFENYAVLNPYLLFPDPIAFFKDSVIEIKHTYCAFHQFEVCKSMIPSIFTELFPQRVGWGRDGSLDAKGLLF